MTVKMKQESVLIREQFKLKLMHVLKAHVVVNNYHENMPYSKQII